MVLPVLQGPPKLPARPADFGKRCHSIFKPCRQACQVVPGCWCVNCEQASQQARQAGQEGPRPLIFSEPSREPRRPSRFETPLGGDVTVSTWFQRLKQRRRGHLPEWEGFSQNAHLHTHSLIDGVFGVGIFVSSPSGKHAAVKDRDSTDVTQDDATDWVGGQDYCHRSCS